MIGLAEDARQSAAEAIEEYGAPAVFTHQESGPFDPVTGESAAGAVTTIPTFALLDASSLQSLGFRFGSGLVETGDIAATVAADAFTSKPIPGDRLEITEGEYAGSYGIHAVRPLMVGSAAITYELLVRL